MTTLGNSSQPLGDDELVARVRSGDHAAYEPLFAGHEDSVRRLARLLSVEDEEGSVASVRQKAFEELTDGRATGAVRPHLLHALREQQFGSPAPKPSLPERTASLAFASLPADMQVVLWHLDVEGETVPEVARLLGTDADSVQMLAYRARNSFQQALVAASPPGGTPECREVAQHIDAYEHHALPRRKTAEIRRHLRDCGRCAGTSRQIRRFRANPAAVIGTAVLGTATAGYLSMSSLDTGSEAATLVSRGRDRFSASPAAMGAGAVAAGLLVLNLGVAAFLVLDDPEEAAAGSRPKVASATGEATVGAAGGSRRGPDSDADAARELGAGGRSSNPAAVPAIAAIPGFVTTPLPNTSGVTAPLANDVLSPGDGGALDEAGMVPDPGAEGVVDGSPGPVTDSGPTTRPPRTPATGGPTGAGQEPAPGGTPPVPQPAPPSRIPTAPTVPPATTPPPTTPPATTPPPTTSPATTPPPTTPPPTTPPATTPPPTTPPPTTTSTPDVGSPPEGGSPSPSIEAPDEDSSTGGAAAVP